MFISSYLQETTKIIKSFGFSFYKCSEPPHEMRIIFVTPPSLWEKSIAKKNKTFNFQFEALFLSPSPLFWYQKIVLQCLTSVETFISQSHILVWGLTLLFLSFFCFPVGGWWLEGQVENSPMNFFVCFKTYLNIYHTINHQWSDQHIKIWNGNDHRYEIKYSKVGLIRFRTSSSVQVQTRTPDSRCDADVSLSPLYSEFWCPPISIFIVIFDLFSDSGHRSNAINSYPQVYIGSRQRQSTA